MGPKFKVTGHYAREIDPLDLPANRTGLEPGDYPALYESDTGHRWRGTLAVTARFAHFVPTRRIT